MPNHDHFSNEASATQHTEIRKKGKRRRKKQKDGVSGTSIKYEDYLADSGSDDAAEYEYARRDYHTRLEGGAFADDAFLGGGGATPQEWEENYTVGTDINVLIRQTIQNVNQSVCLEGDGMPEGIFGDWELSCFAAAVKHNTSILSIQIRSLPVSDVSLIPLLEALGQHPTLRALDLSGTKGGHGTSKALAKLVCTNPNIIFAHMDEDALSPADAEQIQEGVQYNAMVCPDPSANPFHLGLLRKFSAMEEEERSYAQSLAPRAWRVFPSSSAAGGDGASTVKAEANATNFYGEEGIDHMGHTTTTTTNMNTNGSLQRGVMKKKKVSWGVSGGGAGGGGTVAGAALCPQFLRGSCTYGSRCKFYHPEYTTALSNAVRMSMMEVEEDDDDELPCGNSNGGGGSKPPHQMEDDARSTGPAATTRSHFSLATSSAVDPLRRRRLGSRLRPSHYTLRLGGSGSGAAGEDTEDMGVPGRATNGFTWRLGQSRRRRRVVEGQEEEEEEAQPNHLGLHPHKGEDRVKRWWRWGSIGATAAAAAGGHPRRNHQPRSLLLDSLIGPPSTTSPPVAAAAAASLWIMAVSVVVCSGTMVAWASTL